MPSSQQQQNPGPRQERTPEPADETRKVVSFEELARCGNEVWIRYRGQLYRLQQTRQGKLILTK